MPFYDTLKNEPKVERKRTAENLLKLRRSLSENIPKRTVKNSLLLATWNIRDFGANKFNYGHRLNESFFYIAEIISKFDIVAVQEVYHDLKAVNQLVEILGPTWSYFASSTSFKITANKWRLVFLYDTKKVNFKNIAGQIVLADEKLILGKHQFARTPYVASFQAENFKFSLCAVHMWYGGPRKKDIDRRVAEIETLSKLLIKKSRQDNSNIIMLGDFNIVSPDHITMKALTDNGFVVPKGLLVPSNYKKNRFYDQIAFHVKENEMQMGDSKPSSGVFNFFDIVFTEDDYDRYINSSHLKDYFQNKERSMSDDAKKNFYMNEWRTNQISDHFPLWVELKIDFSEDKLKLMKTAAKNS